ncbi:hypothetical protein FDECE_650 [Fusarium decemcellulare]|nr:hypothetical protein FDECE_650 [Fusarium decemcellulare]
MPKPSTTPRPLFVYGTLQALPLLAWVLTGDASKTSTVEALVQPARIYGYARYALRNQDYPAAIKYSNESSSVDGYLVSMESASQRKKVDDFEGECYKVEHVLVTLKDGSTVDADVYLWNGNMEDLSNEPWELVTFVEERLDDWIDLFEAMEMVGEDDGAEESELKDE